MITDFKTPKGTWVCNAPLKHQEPGWLYRYNKNGKLEILDEPCHCRTCLRAEHPDLELKTGRPVQVHEEYTVEILEEMGYCGMYR